MASPIINNNFSCGIFDGVLTNAAKKLQSLDPFIKVSAVAFSILGGIIGAFAVVSFIPTIPLALVPLFGFGSFMITFHIIADMINAGIILVKS